MIKLGVTKPNLAPLREDGRRLDRALIRAAHVATDTASRAGQKRIRMAMDSANLGKLGKVVGQTSSLKKGERGSRNAWGSVYARGQTREDDRGAGALDIYSEGGTIEPTAQLYGPSWLWISTPAIPKRIRRFKTTPALYNRSPYVSSIGPLIFKQISPNRAILVIRRVTISPKTGRAKAMGKRKTRTRVPMKEIVAFVGIKRTRRTKRFDHLQIMRLAADLLPGLVDREVMDIWSRAA
jgi:hypothetical protein